MLRLARTVAAAAAGGVKLPAGAASYSLMGRLKGMVGLPTGELDSLNQMDGAALKQELDALTLDSYVSKKKEAFDGVKGKMISMATGIDQEMVKQRAETEAAIVAAMTPQEKENVANLTAGQLTVIARRSGVNVNVVAEVLQTYTMSKAQLLILIDMKEKGLPMPKDQAELQSLLTQHADRMIRQAQMRPVEKDRTSSRFNAGRTPRYPKQY